MTQNIKYIALGSLVIIIISFGSFYLGKESKLSLENATTTIKKVDNKKTDTVSNNSIPLTTESKPTTNITSGNTSGFYSYNDATYSFSIKYPPTAKFHNAFTTFHEIGNNWRLYASSANQGKGIASFSIFNVDQGTIPTGKQTYPLYFTAEVRVGVSPNVKECYTPDAGYTNQKITTVNINGITFKKFSTTDSATTKYVQSESYRTIRNNNCYVIEQIKNGSTYRDETMTVATTDSALTGYYNTGATIVSTFKFTK